MLEKWRGPERRRRNVEEKTIRRGRPSKIAKGSKKKTLGIRASVGLANRLLAAAETNDRSLSQEAELRLERSFDREELLPELMEQAFGPGVAGLLLLLGRVMPEVGRSVNVQKHGLEGPHWMADPDAFAEALAAALEIIEEFRPQGARELSGAELAVGSRFARRRILEVAIEGAPYPAGWKAWIDLARRLLGPDLLAQSKLRREEAERSRRIHAARQKGQDGRDGS